MRTLHIFATYLLALLLFNLSACATMEPVAVPGNGFAPEAVDVGSRVELQTRDGAQHAFTVTEINGQGVGGEPGFFPFDTIETLQVKVPGEGAIVLGVLVGVGLGMLFWYLIDEATKVAISPGM